MLGDGMVIDDIYKKGLFEDFVISEVIEGFQEVLLMMLVGVCYEFVILLELVWGKWGNSGVIGLNVVMIVDVWLVDIE